MTGRGDGDWLDVAGEEDGGLVFIAFLSELEGSDVGGVAHGIGDGVRGVNGSGDESLGDEEVAALFPRIDSATDCRAIIGVNFVGLGILTGGRRGCLPGGGNLRAPGEEGLSNSGLNPLTLHGKRVWTKGSEMVLPAGESSKVGLTVGASDCMRVNGSCSSSFPLFI